MTYKETHDAEKAEIRVRQEELRIIEVFYNFVKAHPEIVSCEANRAILRHYFAGSEKDISAGTLEEALGHPALRARLAFQTPYKERLKLVDYIMSNRQMQPDTAKHERSRFMNEKLTAIETVRDVADNIKRKRELESKTVPELKSIVKGEPQSQWKPIPALYRSKNMLLSL